MTTLKELRELAEAATPGPWIVIDGPVERGRGGKASVALVGDVEVRSATGPTPAGDVDDAEFIVAAVNYVRSLLQEGVEQVAQPAELPGE